MCPVKPLNVLTVNKCRILCVYQCMQWFHRATITTTTVANITTTLLDVSIYLCGVSSLNFKGLVLFPTQWPGETTECMDNQQVSNTLWLSILSVVSPVTLCREEHKAFEKRT